MRKEKEKIIFIFFFIFIHFFVCLQLEIKGCGDSLADFHFFIEKAEQSVEKVLLKFYLLIPNLAV